MAAPSRELVLCARDRLLKAANVTALVADRIWYRAPENQTFPNIAGFDTFGIRDDATCITGEEITLNVHVWTRDGMDPLQDARSIAYEVGRALHGYPLPLPSNQLVTLDHRGERVFYDQDGLTGHAVVEFRAVVQSN
ncbi:hypothetical protein ASD64_08945 [Mesorhizobium sp. Root157]|uniref:DUF3168 domain-containing protein n=1 Tax=Mesorhizobium sp. Root157 TaxID=1736477 RepID=UPI0006FA0BD2|nr:DUF3168 domain-containing protein [Mesorhizobium sp. Root157]KQZ81875.1 hypothetical protein ASD64_08945 [Mesorhizobium sp. Root157]